MDAEVDPFRRSSGPDAAAPSWSFVWTVAAAGAALGFVAVVVGSRGEPSWLWAWPFVPVVTVAAERWRRRRG